MSFKAARYVRPIHKRESKATSKAALNRNTDGQRLTPSTQVKGSFAQVNCFDRSLAMLRSGRVRTDGLITHRFPFSEAAHAYALINDHPERTIKVVLTYDH